MIPNCKGCQEDWEQAYGLSISMGWHLATTKGKPGKGHFKIIMVTNDGKQATF